jgi:hypothetical protein
VRYFARDLAPRHRHRTAGASRSRQRATADSNGISTLAETTPTAADSNGISSPHNDVPTTDSAPQAREAQLARSTAVRRLLDASTRLEPRAAMDILTDYALSADTLDTGAGAAFASDALGLSDPAAVEQVMTGQRGDAQRAALAVALGAFEAEAGSTRYAEDGTTWPTAIRRHVQRLADLGYHDLTDYDRERLSS